MRVKELMSQPVRTCSVHESADRAASIMWDRDCGIVPVTDDDHRVVGVVTDRDICMAALFHNATLKDIPITEVMSADLCACAPDDDIAEAEELMSSRQVHRLPVLAADRRPVGMLSVSDVIQQVRPPSGTRTTQNASEQCLQTLAAISEPRAQSEMVRGVGGIRR
jgi:CBS domain-containing protein